MFTLSKKAMKRILILFLVIGCWSSQLKAQESPEYYQNEIGIELQVYPTGFIPGIKYTRFFSSKDYQNGTKIH